MNYFREPFCAQVASTLRGVEIPDVLDARAQFEYDEQVCLDLLERAEWRSADLLASRLKKFPLQPCYEELSGLWPAASKRMISSDNTGAGMRIRIGISRSVSVCSATAS